MKQNPLVISLLFSIVSVKAENLSDLPILQGSNSVSNSTQSCYLCIRGGWSWCSAKWHYENLVAAESTFDASEKGKCCFDIATKSSSVGGIGDNTIANVDKCPARWSNATGTTIVEIAPTTNWWCSDDASMMELALIACRQLQTVCGVGNSIVLADKTAAAVTKTITGLTNSDKCSWNIKSTIDAPSFKIITAESSIIRNDDTGYDIHYVEYDDAVDKEGATNWMSYTYAKTNVKSTKYNRDEFYGQELPYAYVILNPADASKQKRWFPATILQKQIAEYNTRVSSYSSLLSTYNTEKTLYDDAVTKANSAQSVDSFTAIFDPPVTITVPAQPIPPTQTTSYVGYHYDSAKTGDSNVDSSKQITIDGFYGGWGAVTMGLIKPEGLHEKSYGLFGSAVSTSTYFASQQSFLSTASTMTTNTTPHYMTVSVWANSSAADAQSVNSKQFSIEFKSYAWATLNTAWTSPNQPSAPVALTPYTAAAQKLVASSIGLASTIYLC